MDITVTNFEAPEILDVANLIEAIALELIVEAKSESGLKLEDVPSILGKVSSKFMPAIEGASNIKAELKGSLTDVVFAFALMGRNVGKKIEELNK